NIEADITQRKDDPTTNLLGNSYRKFHFDCTEDYPSLNMAMTSSGLGRVGWASVSPVPYSFFSSSASLVGLALRESMVMTAVGLWPVTATGLVSHSQLKVMASGLSLMVV